MEVSGFIGGIVGSENHGFMEEVFILSTFEGDVLEVDTLGFEEELVEENGVRRNEELEMI